MYTIQQDIAQQIISDYFSIFFFFYPTSLCTKETKDVPIVLSFDNSLSAGIFPVYNERIEIYIYIQYAHTRETQCTSSFLLYPWSTLLYWFSGAKLAFLSTSQIDIRMYSFLLSAGPIFRLRHNRSPSLTHVSFGDSILFFFLISTKGET